MPPNPPRSRALLAVCAGAALAALSLLACDGGGGTNRPATGADAEAWFPMVPGAQWVYRIETNLGSLELDVTARGEMSLRGFESQVFVMDEHNRGPALGFVETAPVAYVLDEGYLARISGVDYSDDGKSLRALGQDRATWFLPLAPVPGHTWVQQTKMFQTPEGGGGRLGWSAEVKASEPVTVPAGRFDDVIEIDTTYTDISTDGSVHVAALYRDYYAKGVGLIWSVTLDPSGNPANRVEQQLLEYRFPR